MCGVNGENGERGEDYGDPLHVLGMANRGLIILNSWKALSKFTRCCLIVHALRSWTTDLKMGDLVTHGRILFMLVIEGVNIILESVSV